ncbi:hypothetical protein GCM10023321_60480 [Pseudonocardia eucalypti]|uniref:Uncharacterized protein n=1 Tax=Pseudonocardia eucalypti TaxID=648755 RepID=A0ABP9QUF4_9PSEU|nr:hypothetical protein [Pseudonocardia eucalypti]
MVQVVGPPCGSSTSPVIEPGLLAADAQGIPCYLETSLAGNVSLYRRLGFQVNPSRNAH